MVSTWPARPAYFRSFSGDTPVLMADGTTKPIQDVKVGDEVIAIDPDTGEQGPRTVTHLWVHDDTLVRLDLAGGHTITTTEDHPEGCNLAGRVFVGVMLLFASLVVVLLLGIDGLLLCTEAAPLAPALSSYWLKIHVTAAVTASGIFLVGFVTAALTLIRTGHDKGKTAFPYILGARLPIADGLEQARFRVHALAFSIWTFAVISGADLGGGGLGPVLGAGTRRRFGPASPG